SRVSRGTVSGGGACEPGMPRTPHLCRARRRTARSRGEDGGCILPRPMNQARAKPTRALTIAGSDSSGGAGLQADLATFAALGVFGSSAVTALTVQDTRGVLAVRAVSPAFVARQIEAVLRDLGADAVKTGMLCNRPVVEAVAATLVAARPRNLVVDPVILST